MRATEGTTWEGGQRVPCLMSWPGVVPAGQVRADLVTSLELLPTFVELADASLPADRPIDGLSLVDVLTSERASPRAVFGYFHNDSLEAVRVGRWKLHLRKGPDVLRALFDLEADPGEADDVAAEYPDVVERLMSEAWTLREVLVDRSSGIRGTGRREIGRVSEPRPLTEFDPTHPHSRQSTTWLTEAEPGLSACPGGESGP